MSGLGLLARGRDPSGRLGLDRMLIAGGTDATGTYCHDRMLSSATFALQGRVPNCEKIDFTIAPGMFMKTKANFGLMSIAPAMFMKAIELGEKNGHGGYIIENK